MSIVSAFGMDEATRSVDKEDFWSVDGACSATMGMLLLADMKRLAFLRLIGQEGGGCCSFTSILKYPL